MAMDRARSQSVSASGSRKRVKTLPISVLYLIIVGFLLLGYWFFNKGFAYIGYKSIFVGEITLAIGLFAMFAGGGSLRILRSPIIWMLFLFLTWQVLIAVPGISKFGLLGVRDSVIWIYSIFAVLVSAALLRSHAFTKAPQWYFHFMPAWVIVAPVVFLLPLLFPQAIPNFPGTDVPVLTMKPGDMGVHIGGAAAFLALGLHRQFRRSISRNPAVQEIYLWTFLLIGLVACGSRNRGGLVSALLACAFVALFKPMNRMTKMVLPLLIVMMFAFAIDLKVPAGQGREISLGQITDNIVSVFVKTDRGALEGTERWRKEWWARIIDDTLYGDYFWTGIGYGPSLAVRHGFADSTGNRSPHNGHLTFLARSGVPGLALWIVLNGTIFFGLLRVVFAAQAARQPAFANLAIWVMAYLLSFNLNASVDVILEGPQGGIWFWCLVGYAIALIEESRQLLPRAAAAQLQRDRRPMRRRA